MNSKSVLVPQDGIGWFLFFFPVVLGFIIGWFSNRNQSYGKCGTENRPPQPPSWLFGVTWFVLYLLMGWALVIVWNAGGKRWTWPLITFIVLTVILDLWYLLFTRICNPKLASGILALITLLYILLAFVFYKYNPVAGWILIPLILWLFYANYLSTPIQTVSSV